MKIFNGTSLSNGCTHGVLVRQPPTVGELIDLNPAHADSDLIVIYDDTPTVEEFIRIARMPNTRGFIISSCSPYSHLAWAVSYFDARSIVLDPQELPDGETAFVDFDGGSVLVPEDRSELQLLVELEARAQSEREYVQSRASIPAVSKSGIRVSVIAQIQSPDDVALAKSNGADGVGEIKSELMFDSSGAVSLQARSIIQTIQSDTDWTPIPIRFFDFTADKTFKSMSDRNEGSMGYRGVRLLEIDSSLAASFLTTVDGVNLTGIVTVLPMVSLPSEVVRFRQLLGARFSKVGVTIETPAAAISIQDILDVADYIEIGINDLTQFTMAWDRNVPNIERLPAHELSKPVAHFVQTISEAALERNTFSALGIDLRPSSTLVAQLLKLGVRAVTVSPRLIPLWKEMVRLSD